LTSAASLANLYTLLDSTLPLKAMENINNRRHTLSNLHITNQVKNTPTYRKTPTQGLYL
jgi:hypothetical protein